VNGLGVFIILCVVESFTLLRFSGVPLPDNCSLSPSPINARARDKEEDKGALFIADAHRSDGKRCMNPNLSRSLSPQFNIYRKRNDSLGAVYRRLCQPPALVAPARLHHDR